MYTRNGNEGVAALIKETCRFRMWLSTSRSEAAGAGDQFSVQFLSFSCSYGKILTPLLGSRPPPVWETLDLSLLWLDYFRYLSTQGALPNSGPWWGGGGKCSPRSCKNNSRKWRSLRRLYRFQVPQPSFWIRSWFPGSDQTRAALNTITVYVGFPGIDLLVITAPPLTHKSNHANHSNSHATVHSNHLSAHW